MSIVNPSVHVMGTRTTAIEAMRTLENIPDLGTALGIISYNMEVSHQEWALAHRGEFREYGYYPMDINELWKEKKTNGEFVWKDSVRVLNAMYVALFEKDVAGRADCKIYHG